MWRPWCMIGHLPKVLVCLECTERWCLLGAFPCVVSCSHAQSCFASASSWWECSASVSWDGLIDIWTSLLASWPWSLLTDSEVGLLSASPSPRLALIVLWPDYRKSISPEILYILYKWFAPQMLLKKKKKNTQNPSKGHPRAHTLAEFKEKFPDIFFTA